MFSNQVVFNSKVAPLSGSGDGDHDEKVNIDFPARETTNENYGISRKSTRNGAIGPRINIRDWEVAGSWEVRSMEVPTNGEGIRIQEVVADDSLNLKSEEESETSDFSNCHKLRSTKVTEGPMAPPSVIPTIGFKDFACLLSPSSVDQCLCCLTSLVTSPPPSMLPSKKKDVLSTFSNILNLPFDLSVGAREREIDTDEDSDGDEVCLDFPFCFQCTNKKVLILTLISGKLEALEKQFNRMKETIMNDILRTFVTNVVVANKIPVNTVREMKIGEKLLSKFKRHAERKNNELIDSETQTDITSVNVPLMNPSAVSSLLESSSECGGSNTCLNKRKYGASSRRMDQRKTILNTSSNEKYKPSLESEPELKFCELSPFKVHQNVEESLAPFEDTGLFQLDGLKTVDYETFTTSVQHKKKVDRFGYSTIDASECQHLIKSDNRDMSIDRDEKPWQCRGCARSFERKDHYKSHEERHIINSKRQYFCHRCIDKVEIITGKANYATHCVTVHGIEDDVVEFFHFCDDDCTESYKVREDFVNHVKTHWKEDSQSLTCRICGKHFATEQHFRVHEMEAHLPNTEYYDCQFCYRGFKEESDFSTHLTFHKVKIPDIREHRCDTCGKSYETNKRLLRHRYNSHVRCRPRKNTTISKSSEELQDISKIELCCEICEKSFTSKKKLRKHTERHHPLKKGRNPKGNEDEDTGSSEDDFLDAGELEENEEDEDYPSPSSRKRRRKSFNNGNDRKLWSQKVAGHSCQFCHAKFKAPIELRRHSARKHTSLYIKPGQEFCIVCFIIFENEAALSQHYNSRHRKYQCQICGQQLQNGSVLKQHMDRHKNHPYTCEFCDQGFATMPNLKNHTAKAHPQNVQMDETINSDDQIENDDEDVYEPAGGRFIPTREHDDLIAGTDSYL